MAKIKIARASRRPQGAEVNDPRRQAPIPAGVEGQIKEVALHELGESLVASAVSIQRELRRYTEDNGAFLLEDLEVELPLKVRVDPLGQLMAQVVSEATPNSALTRIRLRIRPDAQPVDRVPIIADQPLEFLTILSKDQRAFLESYRIFSVEDLIRASRNAASRKALQTVIPKVVLEDSLARGGVLLIPVVPARVAAGMLGVGVKSVDDFLSRDPSRLALALAKALREQITREHVSQWQADLKKLKTLVNQKGASAHPKDGQGTPVKSNPKIM